jgi:deoxyadenosine/deoxycytidine kinase
MLLDFEGSALPSDCWPKARANNPRPVYVTLSGLSGAGKSTGLRLALSMVEERFGASVGIDEKVLHHPLLSRLFYDTDRFGLEIQLNFMLQRCLIVKAWLAAGYNLVMERGHAEDVVFARHLANIGTIQPHELRVYEELHRIQAGRTPVPDIMFYLEISADESADRLRADERSGRRPKEFPTEEARIQWLRSWEQLYRERLNEIRDKINVVTIPATSLSDDFRGTIAKAILRLSLDSGGER